MLFRNGRKLLKPLTETVLQEALFSRPSSPLSLFLGSPWALARLRDPLTSRQIDCIREVRAAAKRFRRPCPEHEALLRALRESLIIVLQVEDLGVVLARDPGSKLVSGSCGSGAMLQFRPPKFGPQRFRNSSKRFSRLWAGVFPRSNCTLST